MFQRMEQTQGAHATCPKPQGARSGAPTPWGVGVARGLATPSLACRVGSQQGREGPL